MKKILLLALLICTCFLPCSAANDLYYLTSDDYSETYLGTHSIKIIKLAEDERINTLATIFEHVFINAEGQEIYHMNALKIPNVERLAIKYQYDELQRKHKLLELIYFDKDNNILRHSYAKDPKWRDIEAGTADETVFNRIFEYIHKYYE